MNIIIIDEIDEDDFLWVAFPPDARRAFAPSRHPLYRVRGSPLIAGSCVDGKEGRKEDEYITQKNK